MVHTVHGADLQRLAVDSVGLDSAVRSEPREAELLSVADLKGIATVPSNRECGLVEHQPVDARDAISIRRGCRLRGR